ncbi:MAG: hypothetical protein J6C44_08420 [Muribaculaceae bacterium]|nr:hypothetical protein [Muribaculaceae bacterium]
MMKKILSLLLVAIAITTKASTSADSAQYQVLSQKADMYVSNDQWSNATAIYITLLEKFPKLASDYGKAMTVMTLAGDTTMAVGYLEHATRNLVSPEAVFESIRGNSFSLGYPDIYQTLLYRCREAYPWLARIVDRSLLSYYIFRNNGPLIVQFARAMLDGLPSSIHYNRILANGLMLCGDTSAAIETWKKILVIDPQNYATILDLANYYLSVGNLDASLPYFRQAYDIYPTPYVAKILNRGK